MGLGVDLDKFIGLLRYFIDVVIARCHRLFRPKRIYEITAVVISCGETTYEESLSSVKGQSVSVNVATIQDVHPLSASLDAALNACRTKWLLMVDADTILFPNCIDVMQRRLKPEIGMVSAMLFDKVYGAIGYLRLVDADTLKAHNFHYPSDDPYPDRKARDFLLDRGLKRVVVKSIVGLHNPYGTKLETFRRFYGTYQKRDANEQEMHSHASLIVKFAYRHKAWTDAYYMMGGLICGALSDHTKARDYIADAEMTSYFKAILAKDATNVDEQNDVTNSIDPKRLRD